MPGTKTTVSLWNNALRFHQPIRLPIYGGVLEISDLAIRDLIGDPQAVSLSLEARNLQLQRLTEALGWYRFGGTLSGSIPKIEWDGGSLRSQAQIQVDVFGGRVQISKLEVESPFSSVPSVKLDALFRDIDLEQASETFAFGRISGTLEGTLNELAMTAGQPSQFRADVRSVEKPGVSQRISVESLNKITVLSSGTDAGALYGGIAGFFDSFRYSKLGFKATLKNEVSRCGAWRAVEIANISSSAACFRHRSTLSATRKQSLSPSCCADWSAYKNPNRWRSQPTR